MNCEMIHNFLFYLPIKYKFNLHINHKTWSPQFQIQAEQSDSIYDHDIDIKLSTEEDLN